MSTTDKPEVGDIYNCEACGMQLKITVACNCQKDMAPSFQCCGAEMRKGDPLAGKTLPPEAARGDYTA
jgi:hypothetical protein